MTVDIEQIGIRFYWANTDNHKYITSPLMIIKAITIVLLQLEFRNSKKNILNENSKLLNITSDYFISIYFN